MLEKKGEGKGKYFYTDTVGGRRADPLKKKNVLLPALFLRPSPPHPEREISYYHGRRPLFSQNREKLTRRKRIGPPSFTSLRDRQEKEGKGEDFLLSKPCHGKKKRSCPLLITQGKKSGKRAWEKALTSLLA